MLYVFDTILFRPQYAMGTGVLNDKWSSAVHVLPSELPRTYHSLSSSVLLCAMLSEYPEIRRGVLVPICHQVPLGNPEVLAEPVYA